jgi:predicted  nucleic acid-binding Zn-ribbon protein
VLQKEVGVERGLRDLQDEVAEAQKQFPKIPAIVARFDAEQNSLKAEQACLQRELEATTKKVSRLRVDQAIADYSISELRKETSKAASIELETSTSRFVMGHIDPVAASTLRDFAAQVIDARALSGCLAQGAPHD